MNKQSCRKRFVRAMMATAIGGSVFQLSGCDPAVRSTLVGGLQVTAQSLSSALISAFFLSLQDDDGTGGSLTTT